MIDERYDRSADMRLVELHREALGLPPRVVGSTSYADGDASPGTSADTAAHYLHSGTILIAAIDAQPRSLLIPGALVTISLSVANDGDVPAGNVRMNIALPANTSYRPSTLCVDESPNNDALALDLFGKGIEMGDVAPGARRTVVVKLLIEAGVGDIVLSPHLSAASGAVIGFRAMRLTRAAATSHGSVVERPFYESDAAEHAREPLVLAAPEQTITVLQPSEYPVALKVTSKSGIVGKKRAPKSTATPPVTTAPDAQTKPPPTGRPRAKGSVKPKSTGTAVPRIASTVQVIPRPKIEVARPKIELARPKIEVVRSIDDRILIVGRGGPILTVRIGRRRLAALTRLFHGPSLGMIAHYLLLNALAATDAVPGDPADGSISAFVADQEERLSRALVTTRLGKPPALNSVGAALPAFPTALATHADCPKLDAPSRDEALLIRAFQLSEMSFLQRMLANATAAPFLRATQLFVGLCANDAVYADGTDRRAVSQALSTYVSLATAEMSRSFFRAKTSGAPALFNATDAAFDDAARTVLTAVGQMIA